ncbi:hypothetical protein [Paludibaculum fermentans]|uniref:hypothetical protein n=1 Tax=Paludibaculum fermentans TaxID=1473598 RepID=UPI003EB9D4DA
MKAPLSEETGIAMITKRFAITIPLLMGVLLAQSQKAQALLMALSANSRQVVTYEWKQKSTVIRRGTPAGFKIDEVRFDSNGQPVRITLAQPEAKKMGPIKARKAAEIKDDIQDVMQLAGQYTNPHQLSQAIRKGEIWEGQGSLRIRARSIIFPADEMNMVVSSASCLPVRVEFKTQHEGRPVMIEADYQQLANGPNMLVQMTVRIPGDDVVVRVESFDFMRMASRAVPGL